MQTIRLADPAVRPADPTGEAAKTTDRRVLAAVGQAGETVMEEDRVVRLMIVVEGNPMPPTAPVRALGLVTQVTRPGNARSRTISTCLLFRRVLRSANRGFERCTAPSPSPPLIRQLPTHGSGG